MDATRPRRAGSDESDDVANLYLASRRAAYPAIPASVHPDDDVRRHFREDVFSRHEVFVLGPPGQLLAFLVLSAGWVEHLYVHPDHLGEGLGSTLLADAQSRRESLELWAFQANARARRFYAKHGFAEVAMTDGDNEEGAPDVRCRWTNRGGPPERS